MAFSICTFQRRILLLLSVLILYSHHTSLVVKVDARKLTFAISPKSTDNPFYDQVGDGCIDRAMALTASHLLETTDNNNDDGTEEVDEIECLYVGPSTYNEDGIEQAALVEALILGGGNTNNTSNSNSSSSFLSGPIDGLSIAVTNPQTMKPVIQKALAQGIPVITFDTDDPDSGRASYIGTDNFFLGERLGKVLNQLKPTGGTYVIVTGDSPNLVEREQGVRTSLVDGEWTELANVSPAYIKGDASETIGLMRTILQANPNITAMIPVLGHPMFDTRAWSLLVTTYPKVTFVVGDGLPVQLDLLSRGKVQGLVAQLPYEMGSISVDTLYQLIQQPNTDVPDFQGTNVLEHVKVPLVLPELISDNHYLGTLSILGFCLFGLVAATSMGFASWAIINRNIRVIKVAQPEFLVMVAMGALVMGSAIIPLSFDDSSPKYTEARGTVICMSVPWLVFLGFTITISALGAKTWRVNRLFRSSQQFQRGQVTVRDVFLPCIILMAANIIVLLTWTLVDPIYYVRKDSEGTDAWNRVIGTYGTCVADNPLPYILPLGILNLGTLVLANYEAYLARNIQGEFSESKYIGYCMLAMLQAAVIGAPILVLVKDLPEAWYFTLCIMLFMISMVILCTIFTPKIIIARNFVQRSAGSQNQVIRDYIHGTQEAIKKEKTTSTPVSTMVSKISHFKRNTESQADSEVLPESDYKHSALEHEEVIEEEDSNFEEDYSSFPSPVDIGEQVAK